MYLQKINKIALVLTPFFAFSKFIGGMIMVFVWKYVLESVSSDPSATPEILLRDISEAIVSGYTLLVLLIFSGSYYLYKKQRYIISIALLVLMLAVGIVFNPLVL